MDVDSENPKLIEEIEADPQHSAIIGAYMRELASRSHKAVAKKYGSKAHAKRMAKARWDNYVNHNKPNVVLS